MHIGIIADDLTGAVDCAAPFAVSGLKTYAKFNVQLTLPDEGKCYDVLAINTGTRSLNQDDTQVISRVRNATIQLSSCSPTILYKKIDSTLRGHLRVELDAIRQVCPERIPIICSAYPALGREIINDILTVHSVPYGSARSAFGYENSKANGQSSSSCRDSLIAQLVSSEITDLSIPIFLDAASDNELAILAEIIMQRPDRYLPVGSAGLASQLARIHPYRTGASNTRLSSYSELLADKIDSKALVIVGSNHKNSRDQADYLTTIIGSEPVILNGSSNSAAVALAKFEEGDNTVLVMTAAESVPGGADFLIHQFAAGLRKALELNSRIPFGVLFVTGGETASILFEEFGAIGMQVNGEVQHGICHGKLRCLTGTSVLFDTIPIITKSGGFGDDTAIAECLSRLRFNSSVI